MMPRLDGVAATSAIREFDPRTPIIAATSSAAPADVAHYFEQGMNDVLPKPFSRDGLFEILGVSFIASLEKLK
jgi:osomolarity two-component system, response regulator SKN7